MISRQIRILGWTLALAVPVCGGWAWASDPLPELPTVAEETPAFQAPAEPPEDDAPRESAAPEPAGLLALEDALALALIWSPELQAFSWETRAGEARVLQAGKPPNPEIDVRYYRLGERGQVEDVPRTRVILSQVIELGGKPSRREKLAEAEHDVADWDYEMARIRVATTVASQFVAVLGAQRLVASHTESVEFLEQTRDKVLGLVESGAVRSLEAPEVKRRMGLARVELQRVASRLLADRFRLSATWGSRSPNFSEAVGDLEQVVRIPEIDVVLKLAEESPLAARWNAELRRGKAAVSLAKAGRVPDLTLGGGVRWQQDQADPDYLLDLEIAIPLFDRKKGDVLEARYNLAGARAEKNAADAASSEAVAEYYFSLLEADARRLTLRDEVLPAARVTFQAYRTALASGMDRLGDLFDSRRNLVRAEAQYTGALVDFHQALAALESIVGRSLALAAEGAE